MIYKIVLGLIITALTTLLAIKKSEKYRFRKTVYNELVKFCNLVVNDIYFTSKTVDEFVSKMPDSLKEVTNLKDNDFKEGYALTVSDERFLIGERKDIEDFFNLLGLYEREGSVNVINYYKTKFIEKQSECESYYKKTAAFYLKIGALSGALIAVILI